MHFGFIFSLLIPVSPLNIFLCTTQKLQAVPEAARLPTWPHSHAQPWPCGDYFLVGSAS